MVMFADVDCDNVDYCDDYDDDFHDGDDDDDDDDGYNGQTVK